MHFWRGRYTQSYFSFVLAFTNYEHVVAVEKVQCLEYMVLISVLSNTPVAPLSLPTTKALQSEPLVLEASRLTDVFDAGGYRALKEAFRGSPGPLKKDGFVKEIFEVIKHNSV